MQTRSTTEMQSDVFGLTAKILDEKQEGKEGLRGLPTGYYVEQDLDLLVIRRLDGSMVAAFGAFAADPEAREATKEGHNREALAPDVALVHPRLRVRFLGRFEVFRDSEAMPLGRNAKALAVLKYLLVHRDRPASQDYLMGWLWPKSDLKRARWSLNSAIYALRKLLGDYLPSLPASEAVLFETGGYRLSPHVLLDVDTDEFDSCYEEGRRLEEAGRAPEAVSEYEKAAELYRGDYLIEDLYEEWTMIERERLLDAYTDLLRRLAVRYTETGHPWESVRTYYRILEKDRCHEYAHHLLMECYVRLGQRTQALRQYGLCERALRNEYDMVPSPETRALYASILKEGAPARNSGTSELAPVHRTSSDTADQWTSALKDEDP